MTLVLSYMSLHINCAASVSPSVQKHANAKKVTGCYDLGFVSGKHLQTFHFFKEKEK